MIKKIIKKVIKRKGKIMVDLELLATLQSNIATLIERTKRLSDEIAEVKEELRNMRCEMSSKFDIQTDKINNGKTELKETKKELGFINWKMATGFGIAITLFSTAISILSNYYFKIFFKG